MTSRKIANFSAVEPSKEVYEGVVTALCDALGVDTNECAPAATLVGDLGVESVDFLDIVFIIEKRFDMEIRRAELMPEDILLNPAYLRDGRGRRIRSVKTMPPDAILTPVGVQALKLRMPWLCLDEFEQDAQVYLFGNFMTVRDLCRFVEWQLDQARSRG